MPRIIDEGVRSNFMALVNAIKKDQARVYACMDYKTGDTVPVVCYVGPHPSDKSQTTVIPLAMLFSSEESATDRLQLLRQQGEGEN
jgi:hypothetical protein